MERPSIKSIQPVNLLSFGPKTQPIELRPLNLLIGPNGSGKSNFIEMIRLMHFLPDKDPWAVVLATGGVSEWAWKGARQQHEGSLLRATLSIGESKGNQATQVAPCFDLQIGLKAYLSSFRVQSEWIRSSPCERARWTNQSRFERDGTTGRIHLAKRGTDAEGASSPVSFDLNLDRSILSQLASRPAQSSGIGIHFPELFSIADFLESFDFHQDWVFGVYCSPRDLQPVGQPSDKLTEDASNLAQFLARLRDAYKPEFERLTELVRRFYEPTKSVEIRLQSTYLEIAIGEQGFVTPASRLSDGMLRWLALVSILLNPTPAPVTCIDEPELGLHPDIIPILADLLRDASSRTQLIVTTHSPALIDAFSNEPESVCVCEKENRSTVIRRLDKSELDVWLKDYSLGNLWTSGQIGGNRW